ncbi:KamA family radical SAM protein [bacterium]|nr:KamA family radical SAM protein [bacterium]
MSKKLYNTIINGGNGDIKLFSNRFQVEFECWDDFENSDLRDLWHSNPDIHRILRDSISLDEARDFLYDYLARRERWIFEVDNKLHPLEKANIRECIRVFRSILAPINELRTGHSSLYYLWKLAVENENALPQPISRGFILEFIHLFRGVVGLSHIYSPTGICKEDLPHFSRHKGRKAAILRSEVLDREGEIIESYINRYPSGMEPAVVRKRKDNRDRILRYFDSTIESWNNYHWHLEHVIREEKTLSNLVDLTDIEKEGIRIAVQNKIPFGVTPYYASLMDKESSRIWDHQIRSQVIPPLDYSRIMAEHKADRTSAFDFMGEVDTSPVDLVTRRYPKIAIFKPYNTCSQICVYCQRNWEVQEVLSPGALAPPDQQDAALTWFEEHPTITEVLITGGDPALMEDSQIDYILSRFAAIEHIKRIRFATRTPVVLPFRITDDFVDILARYHQPGRREVAVVTHIEHVYEATPEAMAAVQRIRRKGLAVYNQVVFTMENSRRFELVALRRLLRLIGVESYYTFNTKGKAETRAYRVPIARLLQERKEEARLMPGLTRTDEAVFNVPRMGKNHLRAAQDRRLVMIRPDGRRIYEFHPWEKNLLPVDIYFNYVDVSIWDYLKELDRRGEDITKYRTIWYYF